MHLQTPSLVQVLTLCPYTRDKIILNHYANIDIAFQSLKQKYSNSTDKDRVL